MGVMMMMTGARWGGRGQGGVAPAPPARAAPSPNPNPPHAPGAQRGGEAGRAHASTARAQRDQVVIKRSLPISGSHDAACRGRGSTLPSGVGRAGCCRHVAAAAVAQGVARGGGTWRRRPHPWPDPPLAAACLPARPLPPLNASARAICALLNGCLPCTLVRRSPGLGAGLLSRLPIPPITAVAGCSRDCSWRVGG